MEPVHRLQRGLFALFLAASLNATPAPAGERLPPSASPDPIEISILTQLGNDTMFANAEGSIVFHLNAAGWNIAGITWPLEFHFGGAGNLIGPVGVDYVDSARFIFSAYTVSVLESNSLNPGFGSEFLSDPDTLLFGSVDFGGGGWDIDGEYARITFTPLGVGTITIDEAFIPPTSGLVTMVDQSAHVVPFNWNGPYTITVAECPVKMGDVNDDGEINSSDLIYMVNYIFKSGPDPLPMRTVGDANCTGGLGASDIIYLVNHIFKGGPPPCACYVRII